MGYTDKQHADWCEQAKAGVNYASSIGWHVIAIGCDKPIAARGDTRRQAIDAAMREAGVPECERCGDTKEDAVYEYWPNGMYTRAIPCPDCQPGEEPRP